MVNLYKFENGHVAEILEPINGYDAVRIWDGSILVSGTCKTCGLLIAAEQLATGRNFSSAWHPQCEPCKSRLHREYCRSYRQDNLESELERGRRKYARNRDKHRATVDKYVKLNRDELRERRRKKLEENGDTIRARRREYFASPRGKLKRTIHNDNRRARMEQSLCGCVTSESLQLVWEQDGGLCVYCAAPAKHYDHVIALKAGGPHCVENLRLACNRCNASKCAKPLSEWLEYAKAFATEPAPTQISCPLKGNNERRNA